MREELPAAAERRERREEREPGPLAFAWAEGGVDEDESELELDPSSVKTPEASGKRSPKSRKKELEAEERDIAKCDVGAARESAKVAALRKEGRVHNRTSSQQTRPANATNAIYYSSMPSGAWATEAERVARMGVPWIGVRCGQSRGKLFPSGACTQVI